MASLKPITYLLAVLGILLQISSISAHATAPQQNGILAGQVIDSETSEPVSFAYLYIQQAGRTTTADNEGRFEFRNLPTGTFQLQVSRIGYRPQEQMVTVEENSRSEITIRLTRTVMASAELVVSGERESSGASLDHASRKIYGSELRRGLGTTIAQSLDHLPGFESRTMGSAPSRPVVRGLGGERLLILQDGQRTGDVSAQSSDHAVTVDPVSAKEIEVARGPAALVYGSNAIGGVINVVRNQIANTMPSQFTGSGTLQGESVNTGGVAAAEASIPLGRLALQADLNFRTSDDIDTPRGTLENSSSTATNNALGLSYIDGWGYAGASGSMFINNYGIPPDPEGGHPNGVDIEMEKYQTDVATQILLPGNLFQTLNADFSYKHYQHQEIESGGIIGTDFGLLTSHASIKARHRKLGIFDEGVIGIWGEARDYAVRGANTPASDAYNFAAFIVEEFTRGPWHLEGGLRFNYNRTVPEENDPDSRIGNIRPRSFTALASSAALFYHLGDGFSVGGSLMHSFRAPSQEELYSEGPHLASYSYEIGNPDLNPERGFGKEIIFRYRGDDLHFQLNPYHNGFTNYIYPRNTGRPNPRFPSLNDYQFRGASAQIYGIEAHTEWSVANYWKIAASMNYTRGERALTDDEKTQLGTTDNSRPLPLIPPFKSTIGISYEQNVFTAGTSVTLAADQDRTGDFEEPTDGYTKWDAFLQYRISSTTLLHAFSLSVNNILDTTYYNHLSRIKEVSPEPGRNISLLYRIYF